MGLPRRWAPVVLLGLAVLLMGCRSSSGVSTNATTSTNIATTVAADEATASTDPSATAAATAAATTTTEPVDLGELDSAAFCAEAGQVASATGTLIAGASATDVKTGFASMKAALSTLSKKAATAQRAQFASAVAVLDKADAILAANGYDVSATQSQLGTIDPDGALVGAVTVVVAQRQAVCPT